LGESSAQNLSSMAWALATLDLLDALLFVALARAMEWCVDKFKAQELANRVWAFANANLSEELLFVV